MAYHDLCFALGFVSKPFPFSLMRICCLTLHSQVDNFTCGDLIQCLSLDNFIILCSIPNNLCHILQAFMLLATCCKTLTSTHCLMVATTFLFKIFHSNSNTPLDISLLSMGSYKSLTIKRSSILIFVITILQKLFLESWAMDSNLDPLVDQTFHIYCSSTLITILTSHVV